MKQKKYICEGCNYSTNTKSHWDKHLETQKHQNIFKCDICDLKLGSKSSYYRHKKECKGSLLIGKIDELTKKIMILEERLTKCEQHICVF